MKVMIQRCYEGTGCLAEMHTVDSRLRDQWITMQALEQLAPCHSYKFGLRVVFQAPGHLARRVTPVGVSTPFLHAIVIEFAFNRIQLLAQSLQRLELVELTEESLIRWRQLPGFVSFRLLIVELLLEELLHFGRPDGLIVRL